MEIRYPPLVVDGLAKVLGQPPASQPQDEEREITQAPLDLLGGEIHQDLEGDRADSRQPDQQPSRGHATPAWPWPTGRVRSFSWSAASFGVASLIPSPVSVK